MTASHLVGIGGTGSKCVEAYLHLAAAGLGPNCTGVTLVDQDTANGNLKGAKDLLRLYRRIATDLHGQNHDLGDSALFGTKVECAKEPTWSPLPRSGISLKQHFQYEALKHEARLVFDTMFAEKFERDQTLDEGFRGRPAVGAAAMFSAAASPERVWQKVMKDVRDANEDRVRVAVVGSIFGGTGASGLPTIARILRREAEENDVRLELSGILMLPYFCYPDSELDGADENVPRSSMFVLNTQYALRYYQEVMRQTASKVFDSLFVIGSNPLFELEFRGAGGSLQQNPPLLPEFLSALAAAHFFQANTVEENSVQVAGRGDEGVTWENIPRIVRGNEELNVREHVGRLLRFALAFLSAYRPNMSREKHERFSKQPWYRSLIANAEVDLDHDDNQILLDSIQRYCESLVHWCASLSSSRWNGSYPVDLFRLREFEYSGDDGQAKESVRRLCSLNQKGKRVFRTVVPSKQEPGLEQVFLAVSDSSARSNRRGLGVFLDVLFEENRLYKGGAL